MRAPRFSIGAMKLPNTEVLKISDHWRPQTGGRLPVPDDFQLRRALVFFEVWPQPRSFCS